VDLQPGQQYVVLTLEVRREDAQFASYCRELKTASCGETFEEAVSNLEDAVVLHLNSLERLGERRRVFRECNIRPRTYRAAERVVPVKRPVYNDAWTTTHRVPIPV